MKLRTRMGLHILLICALVYTVCLVDPWLLALLVFVYGGGYSGAYFGFWDRV